MLKRNYRLAFALLALLVSGAISFPSPAGARTIQKETKAEKEARKQQEKEEKDKMNNTSTEMQQLQLFNYNGIDADTTSYLQQNAQEFDRRGFLRR